MAINDENKNKLIKLLSIEGAKPDYKVMQDRGYSTYWSIHKKVKFLGFTFYRKYKVHHAHSEKEAFELYVKNYVGFHYDVINEENYPQYFV